MIQYDSFWFALKEANSTQEESLFPDIFLVICCFHLSSHQKDANGRKKVGVNPLFFFPSTSSFCANMYGKLYAENGYPGLAVYAFVGLNTSTAFIF